MAYTAATKLYCKFASTLLLDEVTGTDLSFSSANSDTPIVVAGPQGAALQLDPAISLSTGLAILSGTTGFTIGFFLKPVNPGLVQIVPPTGTESLRMSLLSEGVFTLSGGTMSKSNWNLVVWEETQPGGMNVMKVAIQGGTAATAVSQPYTTGVFHHFWITYDGTVPALTVFIDGVSRTQGVTGTVPSSLSVYSTSFQINKGVDGQSYYISNNEGVIYDLVVATTPITDTVSINRAISLGAEYVFNTTFQDVDEMYEAIQFSDPCTIQVNAVLSDNSDVYIGRSDGKLVRASRTIWNLRRNFSGPNEKALLESIYGTDSNVLSIDEGVVTVQTAVIRS